MSSFITCVVISLEPSHGHGRVALEGEDHEVVGAVDGGNISFILYSGDHMQKLGLGQSGSTDPNLNL